MIKLLFGVMMLSTAAAQAADESQIRLKEGPGVDLVRSNCATCHSLDYIPMNSPFLDRKGWEGEVNKMINAMHAPIDQKNVPAIVDYLAKYYGVPSAPAAAASTPKSH
jgi:mono/diheme cytochrome c family protein